MKSSGLGRVMRPAAVAVAAFGILTQVGSFAMAQNYAAMSCGQLWYARNSIYAANGYCFQTAKARSVFGRGCFPPYGKLSPGEQNQVNNITSWENRKGC